MLMPAQTEASLSICDRSCNCSKSGNARYCMNPLVKACSACVLQLRSKPAGGEINSPNSWNSRSPCLWNSRCTMRFHRHHCSKGSVGFPRSAACKNNSSTNSSCAKRSHNFLPSSSALAGGFAGQCHGTPTSLPCFKLSMRAANRVIVSACLPMSVPKMARVKGFRIVATVSSDRKAFASLRKSSKVVAQCMCSSGEMSLYLMASAASASSNGGEICIFQVPFAPAREMKAGVKPGWCTSCTRAASTRVNSMNSWVKAKPQPAQKEYTSRAAEAPCKLLWYGTLR
mmetsp:Transcript_10082/g.28876  ORF Transcript_10082/g.28876 Transcript_10082/m.28876 type:complete len:285 (+) Transcript_10082:241-1095(+)